jgi:ABC-type multidrug transport system fused ATPase/permease subunit
MNRSVEIRVTKYKSIIRWMYTEAILPYKYRFIFTLGLSFLGVKIIAIALLLLFKFAQSVERGELVNFLTYSFDPRESSVLIGTSVIFSLLLILGSLIEYISSVLMAKFCVNLQFDLVNKIDKYHGGPIAKDLVLSNHKIYIRLLNSLKLKHARKAARSVKSIPDVFVGILMLFVGVFILIRLQFTMTLVLLILFLLLAPVYYLASQRTSHAVREIPVTRKLFREALRFLNHSRSDLNSMGASKRQIDLDKAKNNAEEAFVGRFQSVARVKMLSQISLAMVGGVALTYLSYMALQGMIDWITIGAYLIALRVVLLV